MLFSLFVQHSGSLLDGNTKAEDIRVTICHKAINHIKIWTETITKSRIRRNKPLRTTGLIQWGRPDSNQRPPAPEAGIIPS